MGQGLDHVSAHHKRLSADLSRQTLNLLAYRAPAASLQPTTAFLDAKDSRVKLPASFPFIESCRHVTYSNGASGDPQTCINNARSRIVYDNFQ